jgi:hypothetical protein
MFVISRHETIYIILLCIPSTIMQVANLIENKLSTNLHTMPSSCFCKVRHTLSGNITVTSLKLTFCFSITS